MSTFENVTNQLISRSSYDSGTQEYYLKCRDLKTMEESNLSQHLTTDEYSLKKYYE